MDRTEVLKIMAVLRGAYPMFYRSISREEAEDIVNLWTIKFRDYDYRLVSAAVDAITDEERDFPPNIGDVKAKIRLITSEGEMTDMEAWALVADAIRNSNYEAKEEFDKLPPSIRRVIGSANQLREWAMMDSDTVQSVVASNFQRSYKVVAQRDREIEKLPPDVKKLIGSLAAEKKMDAPTQKRALQERKPVALLEAMEIPTEEPKKVGTGRRHQEVLRILRGAV